MRIVIPSAEGKLCGHFGHCEYFTFVEVDDETNEISKINELVPEEGISCQSAAWVAEQGADVVLAGGMGGRPYETLISNGINVFTGCPEIEIEAIVNAFLEQALETGENSCCGGHGNCHGHGDGEHHCGCHNN